MIIKNISNYKENFTSSDLYIFTIGYEHRSYFLFDYVINNFPSANMFIFMLDDHKQYSHTEEKVTMLKERGIPFLEVSYAQNLIVQEKIVDLVSGFMQTYDSVTVHIDYSSMPRSWYCKLPIIIEPILREKKDNILFWYAGGEYPASHEEYPSSGINAFSSFSGKPSLQIDNNRFHIVALGYDVIRTQAILSITDPSYLVTCLAYVPGKESVLESLKEVNDPILSRAAMVLTLQLNDFEFMISKLCEITNELLLAGDVILIPDGPKPLIFAISLVPNLTKKDGVTCLHVSRNKNHFESVDVRPTGDVYGFKIYK